MGRLHFTPQFDENYETRLKIPEVTPQSYPTPEVSAQWSKKAEVRGLYKNVLYKTRSQCTTNWKRVLKRQTEGEIRFKKTLVSALISNIIEWLSSN